jgi:uncharacterized membrane protein
MECMKYLIALLAVAGIVVSSMALHVHLMDPNVSEHWDCGAVGHSRFSWILPKTMDEIDGTVPPSRLHVPVAALGIAAYAVIAILALMGRMGLVFELAQVGFFFAAFLSYIEAFILEKWCIYCVWSQGIIAALFLLSALALLLEWRKRRAGSNAAAASAPVE